MNSPTLSIVIPAHNEQQALPLLVDRIERAMAKGTFEILIIDDGSTDATWQRILELSSERSHVRGIRLTRNFGHQAAILAGLLASSGQAVITMDADGQHPPEALPEFLERWRAGSLVVQGLRQDTAGESFLKRWTSRQFYRAFSKLAAVDLPFGSADFRLIARPVLEQVLQSAGPLLFLRGLIPWMGYPTAYVSFRVEPRMAGHTSFTLARMWRLALDGVLSFSIVPLRIAIGIGAVVSALAFAYLVYVLVIRLTTDQAIPGWASTTGLLSFIGGIQLVTMGIIGEYLGRLFLSNLNRPHFVVRERSGLTLASPSATITSSR